MDVYHAPSRYFDAFSKQFSSFPLTPLDENLSIMSTLSRLAESYNGGLWDRL